MMTEKSDVGIISNYFLEGYRRFVIIISQQQHCITGKLTEQYTRKKYIIHEIEHNIMFCTSIFVIFICVIYTSNEGCLTFIIDHFASV